MVATANRRDEALWQRIKNKYLRDDKGGRKGQWTARKAQLATSEYQSKFKRKDDAYVGSKSRTNSLKIWQDQKWGTKSGKNSIQGKGATGERYLDRRSLKSLTPAEYRATTAAKRKSIRKGKQFSRQPKRVAAKTSKNRKRTL